MERLRLITAALEAAALDGQPVDEILELAHALQAIGEQDLNQLIAAAQNGLDSFDLAEAVEDAETEWAHASEQGGSTEHYVAARRLEAWRTIASQFGANVLL